MQRTYRAWGYRAEVAYARTGGSCLCGDPRCTEDPHFTSFDAGGAGRLHLVMGSENALAMESLASFYPYAGRWGNAPVLRRGNAGYVFVADRAAMPDLFPVLGIPSSQWLPVPPGPGDLAGPLWITPLNVAAGKLPTIREAFGTTTLERLAALATLGEEVSAVIAETPLSMFDLAIEALARLDSRDFGAVAAALCASGQIGVADALRLLERDAEEGAGSPADALGKALAGVLFGPELPLDELSELLMEVAMSFADLDDAASEAVNGCKSTESGPGGIIHPVDAGPGGDWDGGQGEVRETAIDWELAAACPDAGLTPVKLVAALLDMDELALDHGAASKLALLDMAIAEAPPEGNYPMDVLPYLWPTVDRLKEDVERHRVATQVLAAMLLRQQAGVAAGILPGQPELAIQIAGGAGARAASELFGSPDVVFRIEQRILGITTPAALALRVRMIAKVLADIDEVLVPCLESTCILDLLGG